ncbi:MAG: sigma-54 dependent transcriptional regulator [Rhodobacteraceae bacterium]|nr:sigma-54 dependent transcriptional regulator [Paracoccaceae bacterium]
MEGGEMSNRHLLLIEDTTSLQLVYKSVLRSAGYEVAVAADGSSAIDHFRATPPAAVIMDMMLPDRDGLELMQDFLAERPDLPIIVITANGSINRAVEAMRAGAHEFLIKPFDEQRFLNAVATALARTQAANGTQHLAPSLSSPPPPFIGTSVAMQQIYGKIRSVAPSMASVFITGESGTGKELCAQAIHDLSNRSHGPFVPLNCGAIPSELLESEVFGHLKGSFTGAISDKPGAAAMADGGTLFLDEICELDLGLQTKLLRFLQSSTIQPVGASRPRKVNVRIICATNRDPLEAVRRGQFREDLYYRLHVVPIHMPALRDRGADVVEIAQTALTEMAREEGRRFTGLHPDVQTLLPHLPWPGNVRQLLNIIRQVVVMNDADLLSRDLLPPELASDAPHPPHPARPRTPAGQTGLDSLLGKSLAEIERLVIEATLEKHGGSVTRAARVLDVAPSTLYRKMQSWDQ